MNTNNSSLDDLLVGVKSAFDFTPSGALERYLRRESVENRLYNNFAQVGKYLDNASRKVASDQKETRKAVR